MHFSSKNNHYFTIPDGSIGYYLSEIGKYETLSDSQIKKKIEFAQRGDRGAINSIVKSNQRFVFSLAKRYAHGNNSLLGDLITEANVGLLQAIKTFDLSKKNQFLTYAVIWMQRHILYFLSYSNCTVRAANRNYTFRLSSIKNKFLLENGRYPLDVELFYLLKDKYNITINDKTNIDEVSMVSFDATGLDGDENDPISYYANINNDCYEALTSTNNVETMVDYTFNNVLLERSLMVLTSKERQVIEMLYGINRLKNSEISEVSDKLKISKEYVRILKNKAIAKMRASKDEIIKTI